MAQSFGGEEILYRVRQSRQAIGFASNISDGGWEGTPSVPKPPLDTADPRTFDEWLACGDGRTLWEYANHFRV